MVSVNDDSKQRHLCNHWARTWQQISPEDPSNILAHAAVARKAKKTFSLANYYFFIGLDIKATTNAN